MTAEEELTANGERLWQQWVDWEAEQGDIEITEELADDQPRILH